MYCHKISILHVDDEEDYLDLAKSFLEDVNDNLDINTVSSPLEALVLLESENNVDIIVSDLYMPKMTGLELRETLKKKGIDTPFILLSGSSKKMIELMSRKDIDFPYFQKNELDQEKMFTKLANQISQLTGKTSLTATKLPHGSSQIF